MTSKEALAIFAAAIVREILREDDAPSTPAPQTPGSVDEPSGPQPKFDFDESNDVCEHNGVYIPKSICPIHGPGGTGEVSIAELDDLAGEAPELHRRTRKPRTPPERLFPEDLDKSDPWQFKNFRVV